MVLNPNELHAKLSAPLRYALALTVFLIALILRLWIVPVESGLWFMTFYPAMIICIYLCGIEAGVFMAILSALTVYYIFVPPYWTLSFSKKHIDAIFTFLIATSMVALIVRQLQNYANESRALFKNSPTGIIAVDPNNGNIVQANDVALSIWGYNTEEILNMSAAELIQQGDLPKYKEHVKNLFQGDNLCIEKLYHRKDGSVFWAQTWYSIIKDRNGKAKRFVGSTIDITERKRAEDELRKSRDELESKVIERTAELQSANTSLKEEKAQQEELIRKLAEAHTQLLQSEKMASVGQLAAGVAHEINNPIGFVNSNLGTLKHYIADLLKTLSVYEEYEGELKEETRGVLAELKRKIDLVYMTEDIGNLLSESIDGMQRVKRIVQDLKDFSHVDGAEMQLADLEQGLDSTLNVVWNELKYKSEVVKEYGGIPKILCMPAQLNQVFMNLLTNAGQAIESHGRITVRTGQEGQNVWVEVEDTGMGIKPEHLDRIFDPFFTTKPVGKGTGLGLSLSYGIVQKHGGRIEVKSEPGKGTVFRVVLPQHPA